MFTLAACAGSAYQLPQVSDAEVNALEQDFATNDAPLKKYKRSDSHYQKRLTRISNNLLNHVEPLCAVSDYPDCHFEVVYDNSAEVNAYASEGYKVTIFKGLLDYLKNDDEMAAVVAHEIGHHLANHNEETERNATTGALVSGVLTAVVLGAANANNPYYSSFNQQQDQQAIQDMMQVGYGIGALSYSKEQEKEADLLSAYLLSHAGYNLERAQNLMWVLNKLDGDNGKYRASLLDTHPASPERYGKRHKLRLKATAPNCPIPRGNRAICDIKSTLNA